MDKKALMKELLFPTYLSNSFKRNELEEYDYDRLRTDAKLDIMAYLVCLEMDGLSTEEIINKLTTYNKNMSLNKLDKKTRKEIVKEAIKVLKKN